MNLHEFKPYTMDHVIAVAICGTMIALPIMLGCAWRTTHPRRELALRRTIASGGIVFWIAYNLWWNWNTVDIERGLPLQLCDVAGLIAPLAPLTANRWFRATLYFWGLTLSLQGFVQPVLRVGPDNIEYWGFWTAHAVIVGSALYDLIVLRFRPALADYGRAAITSLAYVAVIFPTNIVLAHVFKLPNTNYGYVANTTPENPTIIDSLGPWPWRVLLMIVLGLLGFGLIWLPWAIARKLSKR
jgi:hypothetical integral membrane protein (TIGR02206 family)